LPHAKKLREKKEGTWLQIFIFFATKYFACLMKHINQGEFERSDVTGKIF
jgi:hypothetical protein